MLPLCAAEGIGVIPWSPQARGKLSRDWDYTSIRTETDEAMTRLFAKTEEADRKVVNRVAVVAKARGISRAQVALAWLLAKPVITAPIVGATKLHHLDDALAAVNVKLLMRSPLWRSPTCRTPWSASSSKIRVCAFQGSASGWRSGVDTLAAGEILRFHADQSGQAPVFMPFPRKGIDISRGALFS
jgi:aldo/keto reductase family protein